MNTHPPQRHPRLQFLLAILLLGLPLAALADMREVSFYCVRPTAMPPVIDGRLDDPCWRQAQDFTSTYEYFKPNPGPGKLKNSIRILYSEQGLYMGILHYDKHPEKIRATVTDRDNSRLWTDDCTEIYIDADAAAIGWRKFVVNTLGTVADIWRIDGSVVQEDWTAEGWETKVQVTKEGWTLETFFPWSIFGKRAKPGDIWMYCHVRYAWPDGKFVGTTSSPGGNYCATSNFGYLCFLDEGQKANVQGIAGILKSRLSPPWCIGIDDDVIFNLGDGMQTSSLSLLLERERRRVESALSVQDVPKKLMALQERLRGEFQAIQAEQTPSLQQMRSLNSLAARAENFRWSVQLEKEFNNLIPLLHGFRNKAR